MHRQISHVWVECERERQGRQWLFGGCLASLAQYELEVGKEDREGGEKETASAPAHSRVGGKERWVGSTPPSNASDSCFLVGEVPRTDRAAELINEMHCCTAGALAGLLLHHYPTLKHARRKPPGFSEKRSSEG